MKKPTLTTFALLLLVIIINSSSCKKGSTHARINKPNQGVPIYWFRHHPLFLELFYWKLKQVRQFLLFSHLNWQLSISEIILIKKNSASKGNAIFRNVPRFVFSISSNLVFQFLVGNFRILLNTRDT